MNGQAKRILDFLLTCPNSEVPAVTLHAVGSGKAYGWCASLSRRISDIREAGFDLVLSREERHGKQRQTWYMLKMEKLSG